mgnify:CR=1 FL=1
MALICISSYAQNEEQGITHYLFPEFNQGTILMKTGDTREALLNNNSLTEEMIFEINGRKLAIAPRDIAGMDTIFIKKRKFVPMEEYFIEIIYDSECELFMEHKCDVRAPGKPSGYGGTTKTTAVTSISSISSGGMMYELKLPEGYEIGPYNYYWLKREGEMHLLKNMRDIKKFYKEKEDIYKAHMKEHDVKFKDQESIIQLIEYLESN